MSHLQYSRYEGYGEEAQRKYWYNQAVRVGDRIEAAGQGGWDPKTSQIHADIAEEISQAFANVDLTLKTAGGKGWDQVFRVNTYHTGDDERTVQLLVENLKKWMPGHQPIWTCIGVRALAVPDMRVEVEVVAHVPQ
ncbi:hypothetical protein MBLNU230_g6585t1 [Neophaeotheca triangularis]